MNFEKILIEKNEGAINGELHQLQAKKEYFQNYVNKVVALGISLEENDLALMFENPKAYITEKLTAGENMQVGNLKLNKEKLFDLIEKPAGTTELIESVEKDLQDKGAREFNIWHVECFKIIKNLVVVNPEHLDHINTRFSLFIENENQKQAFEKLQGITKLINEINKLDGKKVSSDTDLDDLIKKSDNGFVVNAKAIQFFK
ncbi:hypothetical protein IUY40_06185 [Flavobacterium sp. ALJ2]|uniref:hypothetical protein n=1 Tax=Flavobacterium sp. ALJ2 TaxID=2786960 RepID=UPI00189D18D4|nr:hypothetical protein [Flavobacterium sp. ALJ2]MBF7091123.1 hypothetical protein [Flavobacterium sp. ALJ2]